jgi:type II secretion system protein J
MMRSRTATNRERAFTLIEVLLAVSVFAIVLGAINSVFFGALRLRNKTVAAFETALPLQQTLRIVQRDLEGIMAPGGRFGGSFTTTIEGMENTTAFAGQRVTPDIYTAVGPVNELARWADVHKVAYFLAMPTNNVTDAGGKDLVRLVTRNLLPVNYEEPEGQWLMGGVREVRLHFYDGLTWTETWDNSTTTNLPLAIKVQITLAEDRAGSARTPAPIEMVVPVLVQVSTNSTESAPGGGQ